MSIVVTGATGQLGRLIITSLLEHGITADEIVAGGRNQERLAELAGLGVRTAVIDYEDPAGIAAALKGADRVLLISGLDPNRVTQHTAVINAAAAAGVSLIAYTSAPYAATTPMLLAADHRSTENVITRSGLPFTFLRNGWYFENFTRQLPAYLERGAIVGSAGDGRISGAPRADYAAAAATVLATDGHENAIYELGGDTSFTMTDLAAEVTAVTGTTVVYQDIPQAGLQAILESSGLPAPMPMILADVDNSVREGFLEITSGDLSKLIGHPTGSLAESIRAALAS
jgi:NAD(P)H dehydrogenase (quinone)